MWVLVLFASLGSEAPTSVSGYMTERVCIDAGREYAVRTTRRIGTEGRFVCIPGPAQTSDNWQGGIGSP